MFIRKILVPLLPFALAAVSASAHAQSVTITGSLPDPSSTTSYCFEPISAVVSGYTCRSGDHFKFTVVASGGSASATISWSVRSYVEYYDGSWNYLGYGNNLLSIGADTGNKSATIDTNSQETATVSQRGNDPSGYTYALYGYQVKAIFHEPNGTILDTALWQSDRFGAIGIDMTAFTPYEVLLSGWKTFHNMSQSYTPPHLTSLLSQSISATPQTVPTMARIDAIVPGTTYTPADGLAKSLGLLPFGGYVPDADMTRPRATRRSPASAG